MTINGYSSFRAMKEKTLEEIKESIEFDSHLTQGMLADEMGISRSYLNRILNLKTKNLNGEYIMYLLLRLDMIKA